MEVATSRDQVQEICPFCGAPFAPALGSRVRKVQCPKCREVIHRGARPEKTAPGGDSAADLRARGEQLEAMESRIELLERQLEWLMDHRPPAEASLLRPGQRLRWLRGGASGALDEAPFDLLLQNLRALRGGAIVIQATAGDPAAWQLAGRIAGIFQQAAWQVEGPLERPFSRPQRGFMLFAGTFPAPASLTAASMAMTAAGFPLDCGFDESLPTEQTTLLVASSGAG